jgi:hypothetical protein
LRPLCGILGVGHGLAVYLPEEPLHLLGPLSVVPAQASLRHILCLDVDEGSPGVCMASYLFDKEGANLRGFYTRDLCHRLHNNWDLAVKGAGLHGGHLKPVELFQRVHTHNLQICMFQNVCDIVSLKSLDVFVKRYEMRAATIRASIRNGPQRSATVPISPDSARNNLQHPRHCETILQQHATRKSQKQPNRSD